MPNLESVNTLPQRQDAWSASHTTVCVCYRVVVEAEADSLCRVLNLFAMQYLIAHRINVLQQDDVLNIELEVAGLTWHRAQVISEKMRALIMVCSVELEQMAPLHVSNSAVCRAVG